MSPEVSLEDISVHARARGFSQEGVFLYFFILFLPSIFRRDPGDMELWAHHVEQAAKLAGISVDSLAGQDRIVAFVNRMARDVIDSSLLELKDDMIVTARSLERIKRLINPTLDTAPTNAIAAEENELRDPFLLRAIHQAVEGGKSPFVVYGGSHITKLKPALDYLYS
jgi:hypothetical protein